MHVIELGQAAAVFAIALGLSTWRVVVAPSATNRGTDRLLGLCTAISACWMAATCLVLETSAFQLW
ncbi:MULTISPECIES: hypothetical protein [unclassified Nocardioides]|jgi:hypothetical protein|uniref:hypothetical protein n=1 Tax=unclassified Nocardioides TaxID=2615069 RepID=UPI0007037960|nr:MULTISPECIES: hypothetical protein [unclassified Nocardioides]KRC57744.1 hypothetical protein ASE19_23600 [Nocardioides sp. Root79]KRC74947.1 hypothetical protein ASE20_23560 [Nocardioides sp. Root240]